MARNPLVFVWLLWLALGVACSAQLSQGTVITHPPGAAIFSATTHQPLGFTGSTKKIDLPPGLSSVPIEIEKEGFASMRADLTRDAVLEKTLQPTTLGGLWELQWTEHRGRTLAGMLVIVIGFAAAAWRISRWKRIEQRILLQQDAPPPQVQYPTLVGRLIDEYQVEQHIGEGAFAHVYRVTDTRDNYVAALKVMKANAMEESNRERFQLEMLVDLHHPHIVQVLRFGDYQNMPYIAMEFVPGQTLRDYMAKPIPIDHCVHMGIQMCDALACAHKSGIIHRDLKPENVMVMEDGNVKVMDFGIAKHLTRETSTQTNTMIGTPRYMSPEHLDSKRIDARSDVYSLGVILFEMLAGRAPFEDEKIYELIAAHAYTEPPNLRDFNPDVPPALSEIVHRMLRKKLTDRYQSMIEAGAALASFQSS